MSRGGYYGGVYSAVLAHCAPYGRPEGPWSFLAAPADCYRPIGDPAAALRALLSAFALSRLRRCGVVDVGPDGEVRLVPALVNPAGAIVAYRPGPDLAPFSLLTADGCLPNRWIPVRAARRDYWTADRVDEGGRLYATPHVREAVLLRALGWPATLSLGFGRRSLALLTWLNDRFDARAEDSDYADCVAEDLRGYADDAGLTSPSPPMPNGKPDPDDEPDDDPDGDPDEDPDGDTPPEPPARPPAPPPPAPAPPPVPGTGPVPPKAGEPPPAPEVELVLVGWSARRLSAAVPPALRHAASRLAESADHLGFEFAGVGVWQVTREDLSRLEYLLPFRDPVPVDELLRDSADRLTPIDELLAPPRRPAPPARVRPHPPRATRRPGRPRPVVGRRGRPARARLQHRTRTRRAPRHAGAGERRFPRP
jgi:hypothetical protein